MHTVVNGARLASVVPGYEWTPSFQHNLLFREDVFLLTCVYNVFLPQALDGKRLVLVTTKLDLKHTHTHTHILESPWEFNLMKDSFLDNGLAWLSVLLTEKLLSQSHPSLECPPCQLTSSTLPKPPIPRVSTLSKSFRVTCIYSSASPAVSPSLQEGKEITDHPYLIYMNNQCTC